MINSNKVYIYLAAALAILLPVPGRIAYGIIILIHFNLLVFFTVLISHGIRKLSFSQFQPGILAVEIIALTILFKQIVTIICPVASLTLGLSMYFPAVSSVVITVLLSTNFDHLKPDLIEKMKYTLYISAGCIAVFIIRDIIGFGTITLPAWQDIYVITLPVIFKKISLGAFIATIPGCLIISGIVLGLIKPVQNPQEDNNA